jgi:hypothetical protein
MIWKERLLCRQKKLKIVYDRSLLQNKRICNNEFLEKIFSEYYIIIILYIKYILKQFGNESKWQSTDFTIRKMIRLKSLKRFMSLKIHLTWKIEIKNIGFIFN